MPKHNHNAPGFNVGGRGWTLGNGGTVQLYTEGNTSNLTQTKGEDQAHNNLQPYITCYMWKRTV